MLSPSMRPLQLDISSAGLIGRTWGCRVQVWASVTGARLVREKFISLIHMATGSAGPETRMPLWHSPGPPPGQRTWLGLDAVPTVQPGPPQAGAVSLSTPSLALWPYTEKHWRSSKLCCIFLYFCCVSISREVLCLETLAGKQFFSFHVFVSVALHRNCNQSHIQC